VSTKLLEKMLARYGLSTPPPRAEDIAQLLSGEGGEENLTAILVRTMVASHVREVGGTAAEKLVDVILAGRDPVVELIIEKRGLVEPASASVQGFNRARSPRLDGKTSPQNLKPKRVC